MSTTQIDGLRQIIQKTIDHTRLSDTAGIVLGQLAQGSLIILSDGSVAMAANWSMGSNRITNLATPTGANDAANKSYVDNAIQGLQIKPTARAATTAALAANTYNNGSSGVGATLTGNANNTQTSIDGVTYAVNDVLLIKNEAAGANNGLYTCTQLPDASHPYIFTRHVDMDDASEFSGALVPVDNQGTANANTLWLATFQGSFVVGTTALVFTDIAGPGSLTAGNGITISGVTISVNNGNGLNFSGSLLQVMRDVTGGANLAEAINVSANGVAVRTDESTISSNGSGQLIVKSSGITPTQLAAQASGTGLQGGAGSNLAILIAVRETPSGAVNGSNTTFTLAHTPVSGTEIVFLNGLEQQAGAGADYTISTNTITYNAAPLTGDLLRVVYFY